MDHSTTRPALTDGPTIEDTGEIIRIVDPELDVDAIVAQIRADLARRGSITSSGHVDDLARQVDDAELGWHVEQARELQRDLLIGSQLRPATTARDQIVNRLRRPIHQLVWYYVDLLARRRTAIEGQKLRALALLASGEEARQREIAAANAEVARLRQELAELRDRRKAGAPEPPADA